MNHCRLKGIFLWKEITVWLDIFPGLLGSKMTEKHIFCFCKLLQYGVQSHAWEVKKWEINHFFPKKVHSKWECWCLLQVRWDTHVFDPVTVKILYKTSIFRACSFPSFLVFPSGQCWSTAKGTMSPNQHMHVDSPQKECLIMLQMEWIFLSFEE